jgi:hypothetical protein
MKTISRVGVWGCCWVAGLAVSVQGAEYVLKPIRASGTYTIVGNEIRLTAGQRVFLEVQMKGWTPALLRTYQAKLDAVGGDPGMGYDNLTGVSLAPAVQTCTTNAQCVTAFAAGARCTVPVTGGGFKCEAGFIDKARTTPTPFVFPVDEVDQSGVGTGSLNYIYFALRIGGEVDPGTLRYGGDLVLDVPAGATGTYTINFNAESTVTFMADPDNFDIPLNPPTAAKITILCVTNANCNDNNACTTNVCNANGTCSYTNNYNPATHCCNPADGAQTVLSDGIQCTDDVCNTGTGQVTHPNSAVNTPCGSGVNTECDNPDSCDGAGQCLPRLEPAGTPCGSPTNTECNGADTCNGAGAGVCLTNIRPAGTPCGNPSNTACDNPDTCNSLGSCLVNNEPNGVVCIDGLFCTVGERCSTGVCTGGTPTNCADLLTCTTDTCNEGADGCDHILQAGKCLIGGVCYLPGDLRPGNMCEECNPSLSTTGWSMKPAGSSCNDGNDCTGPDVCDGAGICQGNFQPDGFPCSDEVPANVCTKNVCQTGLCTHPPEPAGLACGDPSDTDCDNPDTCDGGGGCADNLEGAGHACGDPSDTQCDNPDTCDGLGGCLNNFAPNGTTCDDVESCTGPDVCAAGACVITLAFLPPIVEAMGSRYLLVTPQIGFAPVSVALRVTSPNWPCLDDYIDADGRLVPPANKVFLLPSEWGAIIVQDPDIVPSTTYYVEAECGAYRSAPAIESTWLWGDLDNNGIVNAIDIAHVVNKLKGLAGSISTEIADIDPCVPNGIINALDIAVDVMIFKGQTYYCGAPCH